MDWYTEYPIARMMVNRMISMAGASSFIGVYSKYFASMTFVPRWVLYTQRMATDFGYSIGDWIIMLFQYESQTHVWFL